MQEAFTRAQLEAEKATGKPAAVVTILDLSEINTTALLNPLSVSAQFVRLIVKIWADYFVETVKIFPKHLLLQIIIVKKELNIKINFVFLIQFF